MMKMNLIKAVSLIITLLTIASMLVDCDPIPGFAPLYGYEKNGLHYYTTSLSIVGTGIPGTNGRLGYRSEGVTCILQTNRAGTVCML
jgi:hypothetical protein